MRKEIKLYVVICLLIGAAIYSFAFPKPKYKGINSFSELAIPYTIKDWQGTDVVLKENLNETKYNFINQVFKRKYINKENKIYLTLLNAGNFHNPKVCSSSAGFEIKEVDNISFNMSNRTFKIDCLYAKNSSYGYLICYWICIDKNIVGWTKQKIIELYYTLINKNKMGLMIRLDVPCKEENIVEASMLVKMFVEDLFQSIPMVQAEYLFGRKL